jgi:hypothetical protein
VRHATRARVTGRSACWCILPKSGRRRYTSEHGRVRAALVARTVWGTTLCCRCKHPLEAGDQVQLDHADDESGDYLGLSHGSKCRVCGTRCNQSAGGQVGALLAGKRLRSRACVVCGKQFTASRGHDGSVAATCGRSQCVAELKRRRKAGEPDGEPPPQTGRKW